VQPFDLFGFSTFGATVVFFSDVISDIGVVLTDGFFFGTTFVLITFFALEIAFFAISVFAVRYTPLPTFHFLVIFFGFSDGNS